VSTHYLAFTPLQEPFDIGELDDCGRVQIVFNVLAWKRASATLLQDVVAVLVAASVGVEGESIFASSKAIIPRGDGPVLSVRQTGGASPLGTHNDGAAAYRMPGVQVTVRGGKWAEADAMAQAAYAALVAVRNQALAS
jgi:hypothetical protein